MDDKPEDIWNDPFPEADTDDAMNHGVHRFINPTRIGMTLKAMVANVPEEHEDDRDLFIQENRKKFLAKLLDELKALEPHYVFVLNAFFDEAFLTYWRERPDDAKLFVETVGQFREDNEKMPLDFDFRKLMRH